MSERVRITDVAPRDGLQNEARHVPTRDKAELVRLLAACGVDEVEVTSFVSAAWVPQLGDARDLCALLRPPLPEGGGWGVGGRGKGPFARWTPPPRQPITMARARALRKSATGPEKALWAILRNRPLIGAKFRRQHPFGPYILDFFCHEYLLAVELDGQTHAGEPAHSQDAVRDAWVKAQGVTTLRFSDDAVITSPAAVAEAIHEAMRKLVPTSRRSPTPLPPPSGRGCVFSALVPNERGLGGVLDANRAAGWNVIGKVAVFTAASETFTKRNTNATIAQTLERFTPVIAQAHAAGLPVRGYVSCVVACPFEGPIAPGAVVGVCRDLIALGVDEIDLGDTIGAGTPETIRELLRAYDAALGVRGGGPMTLHLHDTFGRAASCVREALALGVRSFDGAAGGLGGCPYAGTAERRAPGNIATETLVRVVHEAGYETGVDEARLAEAGRFARALVMPGA
ncbi:MAG: hypothetical protein HBSAPP03_09120 [Phycisphaerae bacterium]|nr:MAG: hypothetical protein HBSAPP03_09120 [Phycisphaerae bacterium]